MNAFENALSNTLNPVNPVQKERTCQKRGFLQLALWKEIASWMRDWFIGRDPKKTSVWLYKIAFFKKYLAVGSSKETFRNTSCAFATTKSRSGNESQNARSFRNPALCENSMRKILKRCATTRASSLRTDDGDLWGETPTNTDPENWGTSKGISFFSLSRMAI